MGPPPTRRRFLAASGLITGGLVAGCTETARELSDRLRGDQRPTSPSPQSETGEDQSTGTPTPRSTATRFDTIVDMQGDLGCDPSGEQPCDAALDSVVGDDVLLAFPPGEYLFEREHRFENIDNFGIVGTGDTRRDVKFIFPSGYSGILLGLWYGEDWLLENFTVQQSMDRRTGVGLEVVAYDGFEMSNVEIAGFSPYNQNGGKRGLYCDVLRPDGTAVIERYIYKDPSAVGDYPHGTQAFLADEYHRGTIYCRDWRIENAGENGIYASQTPGDVRVEGGFFRNNDISSIRVCGDGSYIRDATIVIDIENAPAANNGTYDNTRGIWWESGSYGKTGGFIENCELIMRSTTVSEGLLRINWTAGTVSVRNCRLKNKTPWPTVSAIPPSTQLRQGPVAVHLEDLSIVASGEGQPVVDLTGRPGSTIRATRVQSSYHARDGVRIADSPGTVLDDLVVYAGRFPLLLDSRNGGEACQARISERIELESVWFDGELLLPYEDHIIRTGRYPSYCVPVDFGVQYETLVLTAAREAGLYGHLTDSNGEILQQQR